MTDIDESIERFRTWMKACGLGPQTVARQAGLSDGTLRKWQDPSWNPTAETLRAVLKLIPEKRAA